MPSRKIRARDARGKRAGALATAVATVIGTATLVLATVVCGLAGTALGLVPPRGDWTYRVARLWARLLLLGGFVRVRARFEAPLDPRRGYVFMANHQSLFDIPALLVTLPGQTRFLAKRSLFRIPIFGWGLHAGGFVPVDRGDRKSGAETFAAALDRLRGGRSIVLFPEETRSLDGRLLPFKRGGFLLAKRSGFPIVPVAIRGSLAIQSKTSFLIRPGTVEVRYGRPLDAADLPLRGDGALPEVVRDRLETLLAA